MRHVFRIVVALTVVLAGGVPSMADPVWCYDYPDSIFCYDFDRNCQGAPPYPEACLVGSPKIMFMRSVWEYTSWNYNTGSLCGVEMITEDFEVGRDGYETAPYLSSIPFGGRHPNNANNGALGQGTVDLGPYIEAQIPGHTLINGSDAEPLVLTFTLGAYPVGAMPYNNGYMSLGLGDRSPTSTVNDPAKAPTDYVLVGEDDGTGTNCRTCAATCTGDDLSVDVDWPTICQQEFPHPACPPKQTLIRNVIAIGALALLDNDPCHCCHPWKDIEDPNKPYRRRCVPEVRPPDLPDGWQEPTNVHLSFFDGLEWRVLREGMPDAGPGSYGDFLFGNYKYYGAHKNSNGGTDTVVLTVKTNTVDIFHRTKRYVKVNEDPEEWEETVTESEVFDLPRHYSGDFNRLRAGTDESCRLNHDTYTCDPNWKNGQKLCKILKEELCDGGNAYNRASHVVFDSIKMSGGIGNVQTGACCLTDGECTEVIETECENLDGRFDSPGSVCASTLCCPYPFADGDADGDVDQRDFGLWQACFSGSGDAYEAGCECYDRNDATGAQEGGDGAVDGDDFTWFANCVSGPTVALDVENPPAGCIP